MEDLLRQGCWALLLWIGACDREVGGSPKPGWNLSQPDTLPDGYDRPSTTGPTVLVYGTSTSTEPDIPSCEDAPAKAEELLRNRCAACHDANSPRYGDFAVVLDPWALVDDGWVVPGDPANSVLFQQIYDNDMPTAEGGGPLDDTDKGIVQQWVTCGAVPWPGAARTFLVPEVALRAALDDAAVQPDPADVRYLSLMPLYNAGVPADRIALYVTALTKLVWSLSTEPALHPLIPVDLDNVVLQDGSSATVSEGLGTSLLFRVDLADFGWDHADQPVDGWEELVKAYPYAIGYGDALPVATALVEATRTRVPIVHGDWFAANASVPPLYVDVLDVPDTRDAFLRRFGEIRDVRAEFDQDRVHCAGLDGPSSPVASFNRVICRHEASAGYCWETFDFESELDTRDVFVHPTEFLTANDGGEVFCSLSSGQQVYGVFDATGNRIDAAPIDIVSDYDPYSGGLVTTGLSCFRCHEQGVVTATDQVLDTVLATPESYPAGVLDQVLAWYPANDDWDVIQATDVAAFEVSLSAMPVVVGEEPIWALAQAYEADVTATRVATDLGILPSDLDALLASNAAVDVWYQALHVPDGVVSRDLFEMVVRDTICGLALGDACDAAFCGASAVPCMDGSVCDDRGQCSRLE